MEARQIFFPRRGEVDFEAVELPEAGAGQLAGICGALLVVGIDPDPQRCKLALECGFDAAPEAYGRLWSSREDLVTIALDWTS